MFIATAVCAAVLVFQHDQDLIKTTKDSVEVVKVKPNVTQSESAVVNKVDETIKEQQEAIEPKQSQKPTTDDPPVNAGSKAPVKATLESSETPVPPPPPSASPTKSKPSPLEGEMIANAKKDSPSEGGGSSENKVKSDARPAPAPLEKKEDSKQTKPTATKSGTSNSTVTSQKREPTLKEKATNQTTRPLTKPLNKSSSSSPTKSQSSHSEGEAAKKTAASGGPDANKKKSNARPANQTKSSPVPSEKGEVSKSATKPRTSNSTVPTEKKAPASKTNATNQTSRSPIQPQNTSASKQSSTETSKNKPKSGGSATKVNKEKDAKTASAPSNKSTTKPSDTKKGDKADKESSGTTKTPHLDEIAVFMHVSTPTKEVAKEKELKALSLLEEQLRQVNQSMAMSQNLTVHVVTVGGDALDASSIHEVCSKVSRGKLKCEHPPHVDGGGERDTLQRLFDYCQNAPDTAKAVYMRNKGVMGPSEGNDLWRRAMTAAVMDEKCLRPQKKSCNVCGLQFAAPPRRQTLQFPENFFVTSCEYVKRLLSPRAYIEKQQSVVDNAKALSKFGRFYMREKTTQALGTAQYAVRHWIGSHPLIEPCDLSSSEDVSYWRSHEYLASRDFKWSMWPRRKYNATYEFSSDPSLVENSDLRLRSYSLLAGLLYRWFNLYNATPPENSWIWSSLPDGGFWKEAVETKGRNVIDEVTAPGYDRSKALEAYRKRASTQSKTKASSVAGGTSPSAPLNKTKTEKTSQQDKPKVSKNSSIPTQAKGLAPTSPPSEVKTKGETSPSSSPKTTAPPNKPKGETAKTPPSLPKNDAPSNKAKPKGETAKIPSPSPKKAAPLSTAKTKGEESQKSPNKNSPSSKTTEAKSQVAPSSAKNTSLPSKPDTKGSSKASSQKATASSDSSKKVATPSKPQIAVFINAFIPPKNENKPRVSTEKSLQIVEEQVRRIHDSYAGSQNATVYIVTVGRNVVVNSTVEKLCSKASEGKLKCIHPPHGGRGELDTLQHLHTYCQNAPDTTRVAYIHNKGSFHPSPKNNRWRRAMTSAVVSDGCLNPPNSSCNACGLQFAAPPRMFTLLFPGNFFAASCQYIKRLLPPKLYETRHGEAVNEALTLSKFGLFHFPGKKPWSLGTARYTPEHWIGSHPSVQPCDLSIPEDYWYWESHVVSPKDDFHWSMFPRRPYNASHEFELGPIYIEDHDIRLRNYNLLPGLLFLWRNLYNATPPTTSWIWSWLPDGALWQEAIAAYGPKAVDTVTGGAFNRTRAGLTGHIPSAKSTKYLR